MLIRMDSLVKWVSHLEKIGGFLSWKNLGKNLGGDLYWSLSLSIGRFCHKRQVFHEELVFVLSSGHSV